MAVNVKLGVDVSQFKAGMQQAQQSAKTLQAQMKANEAQFKATGDKEQYMANQSKLLKQQLEAQKTAAKNAEQALKAMGDDVDKNSKEYQQLERALAGANAAMYETQAALNNLNNSESKAADGAGELTNSLNNIGKQVSFQNVTQGIEKITSGLESVAKKALQIGESLFDDIKTAAKWADDSATMAEMYEIPLDRYLRMQKLVDEGLDTSVEAILSGSSKIKKSVGKESAETMRALQELGLVVTETIDTGFGKVEQTKRTFAGSDDLFWKAGRALMDMGDAYDKEAAAQALFGRSWRELIPLFNKYSSLEEYNEALEGLTVNSEDSVTKMAELSDRLSTLESSWQTLKFEVLAGVAPALEKAAGAIANLLDKITAYLKTDEGQEQLKKMEEAVSALFDDLSKIDPEKVVENFSKVFDDIVNSFVWIKDHWDDVKLGLEGIAIGFAALKVGEIALSIGKIVSGFQTLWAGANKPLPHLPGSDTPAAPTGGTAAAGTAGKTGFGAWLTDAMGISGWGVAGGVAGTAAWVYGVSELVNYVNGIAQKAREVEADANRYTGFGGNQANYAWGGLDNRYVLESYVNSLMRTTGDTRGVNGPESILKRMAGGLGGDILSAFAYKNASGEHNKLLDMLSMDDQNAAVAAMMLHAAGISTRDVDYSAQYAKYQELLRSGGMGFSTGLMTLTDFFNKSGSWQDGRWTIPGYENTNGIMPVINGMPLANMSGYVMTSDANKRQYTGSWDPSELTTKIDDLESSFNGLNEKVPVTDEDIERLGEKSVEAEGHVGEFGERAGGAEGPVTDLGTAAASAASALASIKAPSFFFTPHANGIWSVPWDGYPALLHKSERVVPAREAAGNFSSNLYIESMYMNNGTDAEGLAAAMAAAQRRTMSGYGS